MNRRLTALAGIFAPTAIIFAIYLAAAAISFFVFNPLQTMLLPEISAYASLVFLPHGVRVFATTVLRARAIPGLFLGALVSNYMIWGITEPVLLLLLSGSSAVVCWVVFEGLYALRINAYYLSANAQVPPLHTILLAGIFCSFLNSFVLTTILESTRSIAHITLTMAALAVGDMVGLMVSWVIAFIGLKFFTELAK